MRVLVFEDDSRTSSVVMEITAIGFDDDIHGNYGLCMADTQGDYMYILGVEKAKCNKVCEKIVLDGYVDLRTYGVCCFLEED